MKRCVGVLEYHIKFSDVPNRFDYFDVSNRIEAFDVSSGIEISDMWTSWETWAGMKRCVIVFEYRIEVSDISNCFDYFDVSNRIETWMKRYVIVLEYRIEFSDMSHLFVFFLILRFSVIDFSIYRSMSKTINLSSSIKTADLSTS